MKNCALVLEGGSLRGMFTCGALDVLMERDIWFPYVNGVSAGSLAGWNYVARQHGRAREINERFCPDKRYLGFGNLLKNGGIFNFNFLFGEISDSLCPADRKAFSASSQDLEAAATDCLTGKPRFFRKRDMTAEEFETACRASSSMPGLSDIVYIQDVPYLDGGCSCPFGYRRAAELGYEKIVVVLTRPAGFRKRPEPSAASLRAWRRIYRRYPALQEALRRAPRVYNALYAEMEALEREGRVFLIQPAGPVLVQRLERDVEKLETLYQAGRQVMEDRLEAMLRYLEEP